MLVVLPSSALQVMQGHVMSCHVICSYKGGTNELDCNGNQAYIGPVHSHSVKGVRTAVALMLIVFMRCHSQTDCRLQSALSLE